MPIILDDTDKSIEVSLVESPTNQPDFVCSYADRTATTMAEGSSDGTLADATDTEIVAAPAASTRRIVNFISIYNAETSTNITVTVNYVHGAASRVFKKVVIPAGSSLVYNGDQWELSSDL